MKRAGASSAGEAPVVVEILDERRRDVAGALWGALEARLPGRTLFAGWGWTGTWLACYGDVVQHRFAVGRVGDEPVGIALVTFDRWRRGPLSIRRAHLGTAGEPPGTGPYVERNGLLALPEHAVGFAAGLLRALEALRGWDALELDGFLAEDSSPLIEAGGRWRSRPQVAYVADLAAIDEAGPAGPFGSGVRREWRHAERAAGPFEVEWAGGAERAQAILDELIALHQQRWEQAGGPGAFASERVRRFHRALVANLIDGGQVALTRVSGPAGLLGCRYDFVDGDRLVTYQNGWVAKPRGRVSTGFAIDVACMAAARARGVRWWDWLAGEHIHKRRLSTGSYELVWASRRRGAARWAAFDLARGLRRAGRRLRGAR